MGVIAEIGVCAVCRTSLWDNGEVVEVGILMTTEDQLLSHKS